MFQRCKCPCSGLPVSSSWDQLSSLSPVGLGLVGLCSHSSASDEGIQQMRRIRTPLFPGANPWRAASIILATARMGRSELLQVGPRDKATLSVVFNCPPAILPLQDDCQDVPHRDVQLLGTLGRDSKCETRGTCEGCGPAPHPSKEYVLGCSQLSCTGPRLPLWRQAGCRYLPACYSYWQSTGESGARPTRAKQMLLLKTHQVTDSGYHSCKGTQSLSWPGVLLGTGLGVCVPAWLWMPQPTLRPWLQRQWPLPCSPPLHAGSRLDPQLPPAGFGDIADQSQHGQRTHSGHVVLPTSSHKAGP